MMIELCTSSTIAMTVHAHAKPSRAVIADPISGPIICPSENDEAIKLLSEFTALSANPPHECIMSSMTGVIDIDSPSPKSAREAAN